VRFRSDERRFTVTIFSVGDTGLILDRSGLPVEPAPFQLKNSPAADLLYFLKPDDYIEDKSYPFISLRLFEEPSGKPRGIFDRKDFLPNF
jgi:hypothetical protein